MTPDVIRPAIDARFAHGWHDKYPLLHYVVLTVAYSPVLAAEAAGLLQAWSSDGFATLLMLGRLVSVVMAMGTLLIVAALTDQAYGRRASQWAIVCCISFLPFAFYAKLANLDVPYVFWFVVALWCWMKTEREPRPRWYAALGIAAAFSIATKDQAYGLFLLPGILIAGRALWRHRLQGAGFTLVAGASFAVSFALAHNLLFNPDGFTRHVQALMGPASANYRMFPATLAGWWALLKVTVSVSAWCVGVPGVALAVAGMLTTAPRGPDPRWWLLPLVSYLVAFVAVVGYQYDRFLLPICVVLAMFAGAGVARLERWPRTASIRSVVAGAMVLTLLWRPAVIDVLMIRDSRAVADRWLERTVAPNDTVGSFGLELYLPRLEPFDRRLLTGRIDDTLAKRPSWIVLNTEYTRRFLHNRGHAEWLAWLLSDASPYREVFRYKAAVPAPPIGLFKLMTDREESAFSNLDKINPEILILQVRDGD